MKRILTLFSCLCFFYSNPSNAQQGWIKCGTDLVLQQQIALNPSLEDTLAKVRADVSAWIKSNPITTRSSMPTIPVVVHVIYNTPAENISDEQVRSQIDVLNQDYSASNFDTAFVPSLFDTVVGNPQMQFCLAAFDPQGNTTTGIIHVHTNLTGFSTDDSMKFTNEGGDDAWPSKKYLNIWVCNLTGSILGYTSSVGFDGKQTDGVVVRYNTFGKEGTLLSHYNLGRTCTHEIGHWLGLIHNWGSSYDTTCFDSDNIDDTPNQLGPDYGCPPFPTITCNNQGNMSMDFMDYSDDRCMFMFTKDQASEMMGDLHMHRNSILTSTAGCNSPLIYALDAKTNAIVLPYDTVGAQSFAPEIQLQNLGKDTLQYVHLTYQIDGQPAVESDYTGSIVPLQIINLFLPLSFTGEGGHIFSVWCSSPNHGQDSDIHNDTLNTTFYVVSKIARNTLTFYPNPTHDLATVSIENPSAAVLDLDVVNGLGQIVKHETISMTNQSNFDLDLSNLPNGLYFLYGKIGYDFVKGKIMVMK